MPPRPTYRLCQAGLGQGRRDPPIACIKSGWVTFFLSQMPFPYQVGLGTPLFCCVQCSWPNSIFPSDRHFAGRKPSSQANGWAAARLMPLGTACQVAPGTHSYGVAVWCERSSLAFLSRSPSPPDPTDVASQLTPNHHHQPSSPFTPLHLTHPPWYWPRSPLPPPPHWQARCTIARIESGTTVRSA